MNVIVEWRTEVNMSTNHGSVYIAATTQSRQALLKYMYEFKLPVSYFCPT